MAFRFALAPLLRLRRSVERQLAIRLREASLNTARAEENLEQLERFFAGSTTADHSYLREGRTAAELHFATCSRENLHRLREELQSALHKLQQERQQAANEYQRAYREREALESLRESQRRAYQQDDFRRQQRDLDEAHLIQHWRRQDG